MSLNIPLFGHLDEQALVSFTGRVNVLERSNRQMIGVVILKDGHVLSCLYRGVTGLKAFYNVVIESARVANLEFIIEPEIIEEKAREIHYPYSVLKTKAIEVLERFKKVEALRPPDGIKLLVKTSILESDAELNEAEFQVLCTLSEWSAVSELYRHCPLLDYEITEALIGLRKKEALKVVG